MSFFLSFIYLFTSLFNTASFYVVAARQTRSAAGNTVRRDKRAIRPLRSLYRFPRRGRSSPVDLLSLRFKKFNKVGIRASKKKVIKGGCISTGKSSESGDIYILKGVGVKDLLDKNIRLPIDTPVEKIAEIIKREL